MTHLYLLINIHQVAVLGAFTAGLLRYGCFLIDHLPRNSNNVVFDEGLADVLDVCLPFVSNP